MGSLYPAIALALRLLVLATLASKPTGKPLKPEDYPQPFSFQLPSHVGALGAGDGGCCPFAGLPLPHAKGLARPALLGLGVHKAGTSYLFNLLKLHPDFVPPVGKKELATLGEFPLDPDDAFYKYLQNWDVPESEAAAGGKVLYEVTATYLHTPGAACRVKALLPDAKFVVVLRDPIARAISHWNMNMDLYTQGVTRFKPREFPASIAAELQKMTAHGCAFRSGRPLKQWNDCFRCYYTFSEWDQRRDACKPLGLLSKAGLDAQDNPCKPKVELWMFVAYGHYAAPLAWWLNFFPADRFMLINNDDLRDSPVDVGNRVASFMGLEPLFTPELLASRAEELDENKFNHTIDMDTEQIEGALEELRTYFKVPVRDLYQLTRLMGWQFEPFKEWPVEEVFKVQEEGMKYEL